MLVKIYSLSDPDTLEIRYIGKTVSSLEKRLTNHICTAKAKRDHRGKWINSLLVVGKVPIIDLVDTCDEIDWQETERFYITMFRFWGFKLVNQNDGGCGQHGRILSAETKAKISASLLGKIPSDASNEKRRSKMLGRKPRPEEVEKSRQTRTGLKIGPKLRPKISSETLSLCEIHLKGFKYKKQETPIIQIDRNLNFIKAFKTISAAARETGIDNESIRQCSLDNAVIAGNFHWVSLKNILTFQ